MRIGSNNPDEPEEQIPLEVQLWLNRGWTIVKTERLGIVIVGPREMKGRTKLMIGLGVVLLCLFYFGATWPVIGAIFIFVAVVDYKFATKAPTKFFPADGEKKRSLER